MIRAAIWTVGVALFTAVPWIASPTIIQFGINTLFMATMAQAWNLIGGYTGYTSFGNSVFFGLGTYGTAIAMVQFHLPFAFGLGLGAALAVIFAVVVGLPVLRLKGHYFAVATLALAQVMVAITSNIELAGSNIGLELPLHKGDALFYELALALLVATTLAILWISRNRFGFGLIAIREDEDAAASVGVNTTAYKVAAFAIAGFFTALVGGVHAYWITSIDPPSSFDIGMNVQMIIMAVFGGPGSVLGPIVGAVVLSAVSEVLSTKITSVASLFFGAVIVAAVVLMPRGLTHLQQHIRSLGWRYFGANVRANRL